MHRGWKRQRQHRNTSCRPSPISAARVVEETASMTRAGWQAIPDCRIGTGTLRVRKRFALDLGTLGDQIAASHGTLKIPRVLSWYFATADPEPLARAGVARLSTVRLTTSAISPTTWPKVVGSCGKPLFLQEKWQSLMSPGSVPNEPEVDIADVVRRTVESRATPALA